MKRVVYEIRGVVTDAMIPAITLSCESLAEIESVTLTAAEGEESARLAVTYREEPDDHTEAAIESILRAKDLTLILPALPEQEEAPAEPAPVKNPKHYVTAPPPKKGRTVSLTSAIAATVTAVILAVVLTFSAMSAFMQRSPDPVDTAPPAGLNFNVIDRLFRSATMLEEIDDEALITAVLKSYVAATGDVYAEYFTDEEWKLMTEEKAGEMSGIGVGVIQGSITVDGVEYVVATITNVYPDTPADEAGLLPGDHVMYVGVGDGKELVDTIGYTKAIDRLRGEVGTACAFTVYREQGDGFEILDMTVIREKFTTRSVLGHVHAEDPTVGIVKITGFDDTTPLQLVDSVETLKAAGCTYFVFDLRYNPGGYLSSVEDVLTYFLQEGDVMITTEDSAGKKSVTKVTVSGDRVVSGSGKLKKSDVGRYRDLNMAVLVNEYSASAAELFTANIRDYELGPIVGVKTFGKGSGQSTMDLDAYGFPGMLKMTTFFYYPPCGEGYNGIGIVPDVEEELSEEAKEYNINLLPDALDNQLAAAVTAVKATK